METEESAAFLSTLGIPCCEAFLQTYSEYGPEFAQTLKKNAGAMEIVSVHNRTLHFEGDFLGQSPRQRADAFAMMETFLATGQTLGAHVYVYHGPPRLRGKEPPLDRWQPFIEEAIERAQAHGLWLSWEMVSWCWLDSVERIAEFSRRWPKLRFVLDVKQALELSLDPARVADAMGDRLSHIHILDYDENGRHALPGKGRNDFRELSKALCANGYKGDIILEPYALQTQSLEAVKDSLSWLRETFRTE